MNSNYRRTDGVLRTETGPFLAKIIRHLDATYMGTLEVELLRETKLDHEDLGSSRIRQVRYLNPFYGVTGINPAAAEGSLSEVYDGTQKSYGMWMVPPDVGTIVVVIFIQGRPEAGFWIGCVADEFMNFMIPGIAATKFVDGSPDQEFSRQPVAEFNRQKKDTKSKLSDPTQNLKPVHPFSKIFKIQGLLKDDARGITTSSARRESPSMVFGVSTPGPVDRLPGAPTASIKAGTSNFTTFTSRLGGSSFVMDDGDERFLRKTKAADGPPVYLSVEGSEVISDPTAVTRPHNELIRIRTRTGHQILLHNSEDLIYVGNSRGTAWIEMTSDGKIDIFAEDSVSVHTKADLNFLADRDINLEAKRNVNLKAGNEMRTHVVSNNFLTVGADQKIKIGNSLNTTVSGGMKTTVGGIFELKSTGDNRFTTAGSTHLLSTGVHYETASKISMNAKPATPATIASLPPSLTVHVLPTETGGSLSTIMQRAPTHEPYPHHENLDPIKFKLAKTDRESATISGPGSGWKQYSTSSDTFEKLSKGNKNGI